MRLIPEVSYALEWIALLIELLGVFLIVTGVGTSILGFIKYQMFPNKRGAGTGFNSLRKDFGEYLILGLEFLIAADVIQTMIHRELEQLYILGGIVLIRTVIGYFLKKEI